MSGFRLGGSCKAKASRIAGRATGVIRGSSSLCVRMCNWMLGEGFCHHSGFTTFQKSQNFTGLKPNSGVLMWLVDRCPSDTVSITRCSLVPHLVFMCWLWLYSVTLELLQTTWKALQDISPEKNCHSSDATTWNTEFQFFTWWLFLSAKILTLIKKHTLFLCVRVNNLFFCYWLIHLVLICTLGVIGFVFILLISYLWIEFGECESNKTKPSIKKNRTKINKKKKTETENELYEIL